VPAHLFWVNLSRFLAQPFDLIKKSSINKNSLLEKRARLLFRFRLAHKLVNQVYKFLIRMVFTLLPSVKTSKHECKACQILLYFKNILCLQPVSLYKREPRVANSFKLSSLRRYVASRRYQLLQ
jgi:hypothetical protein